MVMPLILHGIDMDVASVFEDGEVGLYADFAHPDRAMIAVTADGVFSAIGLDRDGLTRLRDALNRVLGDEMTAPDYANDPTAFARDCVTPATNLDAQAAIARAVDDGRRVDIRAATHEGRRIARMTTLPPPTEDQPT